MDAMYILDRWQVRIQAYLDEAELPSSFQFVECADTEIDITKSFYQRLGIVAMKTGILLLRPRKRRILFGGLQQIVDQMRLHTGSLHSLTVVYNAFKLSVHYFSSKQA